MATTVGAMLTSSKLAVAQGYLHLVGSSVDQLIVHFDQAAYEEFLTTNSAQPNQARRNHLKARSVACLAVSPAPSPSRSSAVSARRSPSPSTDRPVRASTR